MTRAILTQQPRQDWALDCEFQDYDTSEVLLHLIGRNANAAVVYGRSQRHVAVWTDTVGHKYLVQALPLTGGAPVAYGWAEQALEVALEM